MIVSSPSSSEFWKKGGAVVEEGERRFLAFDSLLITLIGDV